MGSGAFLGLPRSPLQLLVSNVPRLTRLLSAAFGTWFAWSLGSWEADGLY